MLPEFRRAASPLHVQIEPSGQIDEGGRIARFLADCPSSGWQQTPEFTRLCPPPSRHRYVAMSARDCQGGMVGFGLARLSRLAPGRYLANFRRGPVTRSPQDLELVVEAFAVHLRAEGCCSLQLNPRWSGQGEVAEVCQLLHQLGAAQLPGSEQSQHQATALVDLSGSADQMMARLKQRCRRQIRKAEKSGIVVRAASGTQEVQAFGVLMHAFFKARGLGLDAIPPVEMQWQMTRERGAFLLAWRGDHLLGGYVVIADGNRAYWLVLARDDTKGAELPIGYPLIWQAMLQAQEQGFAVLDLAGASQVDGSKTDASVRNRDQFKSAFSPEITPLVPAFVLPLRQPDHQILFGLRQKLRGLRNRWGASG